MIANYRTSGTGGNPYLRRKGGSPFVEREKQENPAKLLTSSIVRHVPLSAHVSLDRHFFFDLVNLAKGKGLPITVISII